MPINLKNVKGLGAYVSQQRWEQTHANVVGEPIVILSAEEIETHLGRGYVGEVILLEEAEQDPTPKRTLFGGQALVTMIDRLIDSVGSIQRAFPIIAVVRTRSSRTTGHTYYELADPSWEE